MEQLTFSGGDQRLRTSTLIRDRPDRGEEHEVFRGESDGLSSPTPVQDASTRDDAEAKNAHYERFHSSPSRGTKSKTEHVEKRIISYSAEIYRRYQKYSYITGCNAGEKYWWFLERGWRSWTVRYVDRIHKRTRGPGKDWEENKRPPGLTNCG